MKFDQFCDIMYLENDQSPTFLFESEFLAGLVKPGDVAVDCNAHVGRVTLALSKAVGEQGGVLAFEAQSFLYNALCGNLALNHVLNTQAFNRVIGDTGGRSFYVPNFTFKEELNFSSIGYNSRIGTEEAGHVYCKPVAALTIVELGLREMRLFRVDLGGCEFQALVGARETIRRCRPVLFVRMIKNLERILDFFKTENYEWTVVDVNDGIRRLSVLAYPVSTDVTVPLQRLGVCNVNIENSDDPIYQALKEAKASVY